MARRRGPSLVTKKHLARAERERILTRYILVSAGAVLVLVLGLVGYGIIEENFIQPSQPVAYVNGAPISTDSFQARVRYERSQLVNQYLNTVQTIDQFGGDQNIISLFIDTLRQIELQLENTSFIGNQVLDNLIDDEIIQQEAPNLEITVSEAEIDQALEEAFGFYPDGTPTPTATPILLPTSTLSAEQLSLVSPTPPPTEVLTATTTTPEAASTPEAEATPVAETTPAENQDPTPTLAPTLTATPFTREAYQESLQLAIDNLSGEISFSEADLRNLIKGQLYRQRVFEAVTADTPREQDQVWARHILVSLEDEELAKEIRARLDAGEDWTDLAAEYSTDTSNKDRGGDLGWFGRGRLVAPFENVAFALQIGQISEPVESEFGWHIIQVLGHETRQLSAADYDQLRAEVFDAWLTEARRGTPSIFAMSGWSGFRRSRPSRPS